MQRGICDQRLFHYVLKDPRILHFCCILPYVSRYNMMRYKRKIHGLLSQFCESNRILILTLHLIPMKDLFIVSNLTRFSSVHELLLRTWTKHPR